MSTIHSTAGGRRDRRPWTAGPQRFEFHLQPGGGRRSRPRGRGCPGRVRDQRPGGQECRLLRQRPLPKPSRPSPTATALSAATQLRSHATATAGRDATLRSPDSVPWGRRRAEDIVHPRSDEQHQHHAGSQLEDGSEDEGARLHDPLGLEHATGSRGSSSLSRCTRHTAHGCDPRAGPRSGDPGSCSDEDPC